MLQINTSLDVSKIDKWVSREKKLTLVPGTTMAGQLLQ